MSRYRKKPVVIDAIQFLGGTDSLNAVLAWSDQWDDEALQGSDEAIVIDTLEGAMTARVGDWIIRGVKGEFYPCKPEIFAATYDEVPDVEP